MASNERVFELRTYYAAPGRLEALHTRFRDHTNRIFAKHGHEVVGYWVPVDDNGRSKEQLVYILAYESRQHAAEAWDSMRIDPEWIRIREESIRDGILTTEIQSVYMTPTDYSPIR